MTKFYRVTLYFEGKKQCAYVTNEVKSLPDNDELTNLESGESYKIEAFEMDAEKFDSMKEFQGF